MGSCFARAGRWIKHVGQNVFSLNLNKDADGELLIGGIDYGAFTGALSYINVLVADPLFQEWGLWFVQMDRVTVEGNGSAIDTSTNPSIIDSGTN